ncbi:hypothetical protein BDW59DRAFT_165227 [Aspergillus cavernicola]|uniref:Uncharacterized protein n=1 Tax=Aspergillus cavernicola TaxID=176166 RepID=A0ABR4HVH4_9EURO
MGVRRVLRDSTTMTMICQLIESGLDRGYMVEMAQRFRRFQHRVLGFPDREWEDLRALYAFHETFSVFDQRRDWLSKESQRLEKIWIEEANSDQERSDALHAYEEIWNEKHEDLHVFMDACCDFREIAAGFYRRPIFRAMLSTQSMPNWHMSAWLRSRCAESGGCCARNCGCCSKDREGGGLPPLAVAHCTPACSCCLEHLGFDKPIGPLEYSLENISFDVRGKEAGSFGAKMLNAFVWNLER